MKFLLFDDEPLALEDLAEVMAEVSLTAELVSFISPNREWEQASTTAFDVAFLDIELGIVLAKKLKDIQPDMNIIFVTSYDKYAVVAFRIKATGYCSSLSRKRIYAGNGAFFTVTP